LKSLILLWKVLADELASRCCTSATMDSKRVQVRCEHEGLSFLTITLPEFGKDLQKGLDRGRVDRDLFTGFQWRAGLPLFLGGFLDRVFDRGSGELVDSPDIDAIFAIRQLTLSFAKIALPCSDVRERRAMSDYVNCENEVKEHDAKISESDILSDFSRVSSLLFADIFSKVDKAVYDGVLIPKHGPGATADRYRGNGKYSLRKWTDRLEEYFPAGEYLLPNWSFFDQYDDIHHVEPGSETPVKVVSVPKTQKTPRIIAIEPCCMQYVQQGILREILEAIQGVNHLDHFLGFLDQTPNQRMAKKGSIDGSLATLDLSEASDRVSNQLVRLLLRNHPHLHRGVDACRSRKADVPGHGVIRLAKFASMGSALCFPFEAMVFLTIIFLGIERDLNSPLSHHTVKQYVDKVRVYGDDLIVPVENVRSVVSMLQAFGSVVNTGKSFWTGKFRESCGKEYYDGQDVSIVKVRAMLPTQRRHAPEVISLVAMRRLLFEKSLFKTCEYLDEMILKVIRHFPFVSPNSQALGRQSLDGHIDHQRFCRDLQRPQVRAFVPSARLPSDPLDDSGALLKVFLHQGNQPIADERHLERAGRPHAVDIKLRWTYSD